MTTLKERIEYITVVGNSFEEVMAECRVQQLNEKNFSIVSPIERHEFTFAGALDNSYSIGGRKLVAATFARRAPI